MRGLITCTEGLGNHLLGGFSRSIYYALTGQKVPVTLTHLSGNTQIRSKEMENETFLYPNPSYIGELTIDIPNYEAELNYSFIIQAASGVVISRDKLFQKVNELSLEVQSGVYVVSLLKDGKAVINQKWIVIR